MASSKSRKTEEKLWEKEKWKGFVNVRLSQEEKKAIKDNLLSEEAGLEFLMNVATDGYKCSISYSIPEDVYTVSLTGQYRSKPNAGITMSLRHREMITALSALSWCHEEAGKFGEWSDRYAIVGDDNW